MNQKTLNCKYIYDSITENENVYTLQKKNNSTQTINGYKLELKDNQVQFNYNSNTKLFESKTYYLPAKHQIWGCPCLLYGYCHLQCFFR